MQLNDGEEELIGHGRVEVRRERRGEFWREKARKREEKACCGKKKKGRVASVEEDSCCRSSNGASRETQRPSGDKKRGERGRRI